MKQEFVTIKVHAETHRQIKRLLRRVTTKGWAAAGLNEWTMTPSIATIVSAAIKRLGPKRKG